MNKLIFNAIIGLALSQIATAGEADSYEKCSSIKSPSDRVKCYDSLANRSPQKSPTSSQEKRSERQSVSKSNTNPNLELRRDLQALISTRMPKGELENTTEYKDRAEQLYAKYNGRSYTIALGIKETNNERYKLVSYNADTETITVAMPELHFGTVGIKIGDKSESFTITRSFLETEPSEVKMSSYVGRNGFGREVAVQKYIATYKGLAILGSSNTQMKPQTFVATVPRDQVKNILERGKVVLNVKTDLITYGEGTYLMDDWLSGKEASLLVKEKEHRDPTMTDPRDIEITRLMLPVRLISLTLFDGNGNAIIQAEGSEQNTTAVKK